MFDTIEILCRQATLNEFNRIEVKRRPFNKIDLNNKS